MNFVPMGSSLTFAGNVFPSRSSDAHIPADQEGDRANWSEALLWTAVGAQRRFATASSLTRPLAKELEESLRLLDLRRSFLVRSAAPIIRFLRSRPHLIVLLEQARSVAPLYFPDPLLCLDLVYDSEEDWERLYLVVKTKLNLDSLLKAADKFHEEWVGPRTDNLAGELSITEEPL